MAHTFLVEFSKESKSARSIKKSSLSVQDSDYHVESFQPKKRGAKSKSVSARVDKTEEYVFHADGDSGKSPWDEAHELMQHFFEKGTPIDFVEPEQTHLLFDPKTLPKSRMAGSSDFLKNWPKPSQRKKKHHHPHAWHLDDEHSQLRKAREMAAAYFEKDLKRVKIGHFDTGYDPNHPFLPKFLNLKEGRNFITGENLKDPTDLEGGMFEQQWHGAATLALLAGGHVDSFNDKVKFDDDFGGAPLAEVVPIRIADSVALIKTSAFAKALEYATDIGCDVVSMSMAGIPSIKWARAVNRAYENGVTIVSAAGNSWVQGPKRFLPKCLLYPARWERVIAATGVTCNNFPYVFEANPHKQPKNQDGFSHSEYMQGNYGPAHLMQYAIAGYTPNLPWATAQSKKKKWWALSGGGTSSATPQVAAAAALWIQRFRKEMDDANISGTWRQVEAVRHGLFKSAALGDFEEAKKYFGNGCLKAADALNPKYFPKYSDLKKCPEAQVFMPILKVFFGGRRGAPVHEGKLEMYSAEMIQLASENPELEELLTMDLTFEDVEKRQNIPDQEKFMELRFALRDVGASEHLLQFMGLKGGGRRL